MENHYFTLKPLSLDFSHKDPSYHSTYSNGNGNGNENENENKNNPCSNIPHHSLTSSQQQMLYNPTNKSNFIYKLYRCVSSKISSLF
jgi:hypothetical protein